MTLVDTAGLRETTDCIEAEGVERARQAQAVADLTLVVVDGSRALDDSIADISRKQLILKDLSSQTRRISRRAWSTGGLRVSAERPAARDSDACARIAGGARRRAAAGRARPSRTCGTSRSFNGRTTRWFARARADGARCRKNSCSPIFRTRAPRSKRSQAAARRR